MNQRLLEVAAGTCPADLAVVNGKIVNVYSGEIYEGGIAVVADWKGYWDRWTLFFL